MPSLSDPLGLVLFDFDGTLCDSAATISSTLKRSCDALGISSPPEDAMRGNIGHGLMHLALAYTDGDAEKAEKLFTTYRQIAMEDLQKAELERDPLFEGAPKMLATLKEQGWLLGVVTNKSRHGLDNLLAHHQIDHFFDVTATIDEYQGKPAPDMVNGALSAVGVDARHAVLVGDTEIDAGAALNASLRFLGVAWGYHTVERLNAAGAAEIIASFDDLPDMLDRWWQEQVA